MRIPDLVRLLSMLIAVGISFISGDQNHRDSRSSGKALRIMQLTR